MDLDDMLNKLDGVSRHQLFMFVTASLYVLLTCFTMQTSVFLSAVPEHRCKLPFEDSQSLVAENITDVLQLIIPGYNQTNQSSCFRYAYDLEKCPNFTKTCLTAQSNVGLMACDNGWVYSKEFYVETAISEWNLVCHRRTLDSIANCAFFFGFFVGSATYGPLTDWFGRKFTVLGYTVVLTLGNVLLSIAPWYPVFILCRIVVAATGITTYIGIFTLTTEIAPTKWRTLATTLISTISSFGYTIIPPIMLFARHWRRLIIVVSICAAVALLMFFNLPESPRWLLLQGRYAEAKAILERMFRSEGVEMNPHDWELVVNTETKKQEKNAKSKKKYTYLDLLRYPMSRIISINIIFCWFVVSMVYYGLMLNITNLFGNPYTNATLNAFMSVFGAALTYMSEIYGRKKTLSFSYMVAGGGCLLSMLFNVLSAGNNITLKKLSVGLAMGGKVGASMAFTILYMVTLESYATSTRATGIAMGSMAARIGGMLTPFTLQLQYAAPWLTSTIFGVLSLLAGVSSLGYPETFRENLIETLEEAEEFYLKNMEKTARFFRVKQREKTSNEEGKLIQSQ